MTICQLIHSLNELSQPIYTCGYGASGGEWLILLIYIPLCNSEILFDCTYPSCYNIPRMENLMRECKECKTDISHKNNRAIYCSNICRSRSRRVLREEFAKECQNCSNGFKTIYPDKVYCSQKCAKAYGDVKHAEVACIRCEKMFTRKSTLNKFCSRRCRSGQKKATVKYCRCCGDTMKVEVGGPTVCEWCVEAIPKESLDKLLEKRGYRI